MHTCKLAKCTPTIHSVASKKGKRKTHKEETQGRRKEETEREKENQKPQNRDYNLNQMSVRPGHNNKGGTKYNLSRLQNIQKGGDGLPGGLPQNMYDNKDNNFCKGIFKKNSKDQRLPSTR